MVEIFHDEAIDGGQLWERELLGRIKGSDGFLILVTPRFLESEFITRKEWPAIKQQIAYEKEVFWLLAEDIGESRDNPIIKVLNEHQRPIPDILDKIVKDRRRLGTAFHLLRRSIEKWTQKHAKDSRRIERGGPSGTWPDTWDRRNYLQRLISETGYVPLGGLASEAQKRLPLDSIYVTLEADPTTTQERLQTRTFYHQLIQSESVTEVTNENIEDKISTVIKEREPRQRERARHQAGSAAERLEDLFQRERVLVILGDPGSGKSVMCRWIAHQMATRLRNSEEGPAWIGRRERLPILVRISKFAEALRDQELPDGEELYAFLGQHHQDDNGYPNADKLQTLCQTAIDHHEAVVLLDGLDEIVDAGLRGLVCDAIERFITRHVFPENSSSPIQQATRNASPGEIGGNQVVITSRVTGYRWAPLRKEGIAHYLVRPLEDSQIHELCMKLSTLWKDNGEAAAGERLLTELNALHDPAINALKRNPLLLTALFIHFHRHGFHLPKNRSALYQRLILDLTSHWITAVTELPLGVDANNEARERILALLNDERTILSLLSTIAAHMHQESSSGRISKVELKSRLKSILSRFLGLRSWQAEPALLEDCHTILIWLVSEKLGALVELTPGLYGFMHLTIQEYLAGQSLIWEIAEDAQPKPAGTCKFEAPSWRLVSPDKLADVLSGRLLDPRWREPLLFAFGEFSTSPYNQWPIALDALHKGLGQQPSEDEAIALARFLGEVPLNQIKAQVEGLRSVILTLVECYALHRAEYSADARWRMAEELAALRRRSESGDSELGGVHLGSLVDQVIRNILQECRDLTVPLAHLILSRYWLPAQTLEVLEKIQHWDQAAWNWPILTALQQAIPANHHLTVDPIPLAPPPSKLEGDVHRLKTRYAAVRERWQQQIIAKEERSQSELTIHTEELEGIWQAAQVDGTFLRVVATLWGMAENVEAARWLREYQDIVSFLQKTDSVRETMVDAEPERFLWRFGNDDIAYSAAVYLDTNPDGRHKRFKSTPEFGPTFAVRKVDPGFFQLVKQAARSANPAQHLRGLVEMYCADPSSGADFRIAAELLRVDVHTPLDPEQVAAIGGAAYLISDAAFRALNVYLTDWVSEANGLTDAETAALYAYLLALRSRAGMEVSQDIPITPGSSAFHVIQWARQWRHVFEGTADDAVYSFAVCLDTAGPAKIGNSDRPGSIALIGHILAADGLDPLLSPAVQLPFWGISSEERVFPWEYWQRLYDLCLRASEIHPPFGQGLLDLFSTPQKMTPIVSDELHPIRGMLKYLAAENEFVPFMPITPQPLISFQEWIRTATTTISPIEDIIQEAEYRIERQEVSLDESLQSALEELATRLGAVSKTDHCLFLLRIASYANPSIASRWVEIAFAVLENVPDFYAQAETLRRFRINSTKELPPAFHRCLGSLQGKSEVLAAYAAGRLGSHLCHASFAWNRANVRRDNPAWCIVSSFASLQESRNAQTSHVDLNSTWRSLRNNPGPELVRELVTHGSNNGLECSLEAFECLLDLYSRKDFAKLHIERLIPLLKRPTPTALSRIQKWLDDTDVVEDHVLCLRRQSVILLAEACRKYPPSCVNLLLSCLENEDDLMAFRAELVLAGPMRNVERKMRRNSLRHTPWQHLTHLCQKTGEGNSALVRRMAGLAIYSWQSDDPEKLAQWCEVAIPGSDQERALLEAIAWIDVWDEKSLAFLCNWVIANPNNVRVLSLASLAGRLLWLDRATPEIDSVMVEISKISQVRQISCPKWKGKNSEDLDAAVLDACLSAAHHPARIPIVLEDHLYPGNADVPDQEVLRRLGSLHYVSLTSYPEQALPTIYPHVDQPGLADTLVKWLQESVQRWNRLDYSQRLSLEARALPNTIASLLSLSASLSEVRPSLFAQVADPDQLGPLLGQVCLYAFSSRGMMGAIPILFRLRKIDLSCHFTVDGNEHTLLDAVIACLNYDSQTRQRTESIIPQAAGLQGGPILEELGKVLSGISQRSGARRGNVVLACARIIRTLIDTDALTSEERMKAGELLRKASQDERYRRPLYQQTGLGTEKDPVSYVYVGMLHEELARVLARRSNRSDDPYS
jgi:hypothetical protein